MNLLKEILKKNKYVYSFSLKVFNIIIKFFDGTIPFYFYRLFNKSFKYRLVDGRTIRFYPEGQISKRIFTNSFENHQVTAFQRIIKPGMIVVDAGANIGLYSLIASKIAGLKGKVFSFEPSKETFKRLENNIKLNNFHNITAVNEGLGDKPNEKLILRQDSGYGDAERYLFSSNEAPDIELENIALKNEEEIIIDTVDSNLYKRDVKKIDFLKIDTEGFEYYILKGAKQVLRNSPEIVMLMECTPFGTARANSSQKEVFKILKDNNLNIFYWNTVLNDWSDDDGIYNAGDVWVCKNINQLNISN